MIENKLSTLSNIEATSDLPHQMARTIWTSTFVALEAHWRRPKFEKNTYSDGTHDVNKYFGGAGATGRHWSLTKTLIQMAWPIWISTLGMLVGYRMGIKAYRKTDSDGTAHLNKYFWRDGGLIRSLWPRCHYALKLALCPTGKAQKQNTMFTLTQIFSSTLLMLSPTISSFVVDKHTEADSVIVGMPFVNENHISRSPSIVV